MLHKEKLQALNNKYNKAQNITNNTYTNNSSQTPIKILLHSDFNECLKFSQT